MSYIKKIDNVEYVNATGVFPNADIIIFGGSAGTKIGTIPTNQMNINQTVLVKRATGSTETLRVQGQSGSIQNLNNTMSNTFTTLAAGTASTGKNVLFMWDGTNLLRIMNG